MLSASKRACGACSGRCAPFDGLRMHIAPKMKRTQPFGVHFNFGAIEAEQAS